MVGAVAGRAVFRSFQSVMKSVPRLLRGPHRIAMRCAFEEILSGARGRNAEREENHKLLERFDMFNRGQLEAFLASSRVCCTQVAVCRRRRSDNIFGRVERAEALVHLQLALGSRQTLQKLLDQWRLREAHVLIQPKLVNHRPSREPQEVFRA